MSLCRSGAEDRFVVGVGVVVSVGVRRHVQWVITDEDVRVVCLKYGMCVSQSWTYICGSSPRPPCLIPDYLLIYLCLCGLLTGQLVRFSDVQVHTSGCAGRRSGVTAAD